MSMSNQPASKLIPPGKWVFVHDLSADTTDEQLSKYFQDHGLAIPVECSSLRNGGVRSRAFVSLPDDVVTMLVSWACDGGLLNGRVPQIRTKRKTE